MAASAAARLLRRAAVPVAIAVPALGLATYQSTTNRHGKAQPQALPHPDPAAPSATAPSPPPSPPPSPSLPPPSPLQRAFADKPPSAPAKPGAFRPDLPSIPAATVRAAKGGPGARLLVTFGDGVYDVTDFVAAHPGGDHILLAAGGPLEPYWDVYAQHRSPFVYDLLEEHRVGNLSPDDAWRRDHAAQKRAPGPGPYASDPPRHPALIVQSAAPFNAEPQPRLLVATHNTPNALFYVRNHFPVPHIDAAHYRLAVRDARGNTVASLSLERLKRDFARVEVSATLQCAGNRRNGLRAVRPVRGGSWEVGAIGNAVWAGARLADVLDAVLGPGWADDDAPAKHICFEGLDTDVASGEAYVTSVPVDVVTRHQDVLLAYEMNGEPLPADHGFPVRAIVPGVTGARNVKWLGAVALSAEESTSRWQRKDYRSFSPNVDWNTMDYDSAPSIQEMPVASAICDYAVADGCVSMKGYAWSGDGKGIIRVDVSADGGKTWAAAELEEKEDEKRNRVYDWTLWSARIELPKDVPMSEVQLVCKAVDSAYNTQPADPSSVWNPRGLLNNSWHKVIAKE